MPLDLETPAQPQGLGALGASFIDDETQLTAVVLVDEQDRRAVRGGFPLDDVGGDEFPFAVPQILVGFGSVLGAVVEHPEAGLEVVCFVAA